MTIIDPTLIVNKEISLRNIQKMVQRAKKNKILFRPHFKTHQSLEIGKWFKEQNVESITVSSVRMAKCFANNGWSDITIAFPLNILQIREIIKLNKKINLNLLIDSIEAIQFLAKEKENVFQLWIDIDVGYHRDGISWKDKRTILQLANEINSCANLIFVGLLSHAGHSYNSRSKKEIIAVHKQSITRMLNVKKYLLNKGFSSIKISVGDTPTASIAEDFSLVDELRPGNFVLYDLKQVQIGSCTMEEVAIRVACPIVAKYPSRNEILIIGGAIHFSKDYIVDSNGRKIFGYLCNDTSDPWYKPSIDSYLKSISQEHGILKVEEELFDKLKIGDIAYIIPIHACLTFNIMDSFQLTTGEEYSISCK